jgi:capsular exopolysaccharide synthesis family protein
MLLVGALAGLLLGVVAALVLEQLDRRLRRPAEVAAAVDLPVLASIPRSKTLARGLTPFLAPSENETFRMLEARLREIGWGMLTSTDERTSNSLLLTSLTGGEGKTTVALHLAQASADAGYRVLLIEADLRRPALSTALGYEGERGLAQFLTGVELSLDRLWQPVPASPSTNGRAATRPFTLLPAGATSEHPVELLGSLGMQDVLRAGEAKFDVVIIDAPPMGVVADAIPLLAQVAGTVVVNRLGWVSDERLRGFRDELELLNAPLLGLVINHVDPDSSASYYHS